MDARVHHVQGKAKLVTPADLLSLLQEVYRAKLALSQRHQQGAQGVSSYEFNNTYQYVINREDTHLEWLRAAIEGLGATTADVSVAVLPVPDAGRGLQAGLAIIEDDARTARAFVEMWAPRVQAVSHDRHRKMLELMLGEVREHTRFFELAVAGRQDLLGRRPAGAGTGGGVLPTRWVE
jgi:hypothetical protein